MTGQAVALILRAADAFAYLASVAMVIIVGVLGREIMQADALLGWIWLGCWVGLIGCGAAWWIRRPR